MKKIFWIISYILVSMCFAQQGAKYLVITHDNFYDAVQPLAEWKQKKGLKTKVVKLSELNATPESLARIKSYIVNAYNTWNPRPEYVLLVGSSAYIRTEEILSVGYDDYYANMTGNYLMELSLGRMPCSTAVQCSVMVDKTLGYERTPYMDDTTWYKKGTGIIREDISATDSVYWNNMRFIYSLWQAASYTAIDSFSKLRGDSARHVESAVTDGRAFVVYRGQGVANWWAPFAVDPSRMNNDYKLPIIVSGTCATINLGLGAAYLGENFLKAGNTVNPKGAVAFFGTTNSVSGTGIGNLRGTVTTNFLNTIFTEGVYKLGNAAKRAKFLIDSIHPPYYSQERYREWNLLGDPELNVWTRPPRNLNVVYDSVIPLNTTNVTVTVTCNGLPLQNALVCLKKDSVIYLTDYTQSNGAVTFPVTLQSTGFISLTVTAQNCQPFEGVIRVRTNAIEEDRALLTADRKPITVYPNPCHNFTVITFNRPLETGDEIKIYDVQGRHLDSKNERLKDSKIKINLESYSLGIYLVCCKNGKQMFIEKLVKSR